MRAFILENIAQKIPANLFNQNIQKKCPENEILFLGILKKMQEFFPLENNPFKFIEFHPTGSIGNEKSFQYWQSETKRKKIICSDLVHSSVSRYSDDVIVINSRENFEIDEKAVNEYIEKNHKDIAVFVLTGGTTNLGTVEKIADSTYRLLKKYNIPIHADCAYGGFNIGLQGDESQSKQELFNLMDIADSVSIDAHKFIGADGFNMVLFKDDEEEHLDSYFPAFQKNSTSWGGKAGTLFYEHLQQIPQDKFRELIEHKLDGIRFFKELLEKFGFSVISNSDVAQITISFDSPEEAKYIAEWLRKAENISVAYKEKLGNHEIPYIRMVFSNYYDFSRDFFIDLVAALRGIQDNIRGKISPESRNLSKSGFISAEHAFKHYFPGRKLDPKKFAALPKLAS